MRGLRADLFPILGKNPGPCKVVDRIYQRVRSPIEQKELVNTVEGNRNLTNAQAVTIYNGFDKNPSASNFRQFAISPHAQYRMDLRGITVAQVQKALLKLGGVFGNPKHRAMLQKLNEANNLQLNYEASSDVLKIDDEPVRAGYERRGKTIRVDDSDISVTFSLSGDLVTVVTAYPRSGSDPKAPPGGCSKPGKTAKGYQAPAGELSGYRTYPSEKPSKGIDEPSGDSIRHSPGESPRSDRDRAAPMRPGQKDELLQKTPANVVFNAPGPSSKEEGTKIHVRSPGTPGEEYGHPFKENIMPRRTEAAIYPSYNQRQRKQRGEARLYQRRYYQRHRSKIRSRAKIDYLHKKNSPTFKKQRTYRNSQKYGWRFNRLPSGGYRRPADRTRDHRNKKAEVSIPFYHPNYGMGYVLDVRDQEVVIEQTNSLGGESLGTGTVPFFTFLRGVEFDDETSIDAFFDLADSDFDLDDEAQRLASFYRETFRPGDNLDPGDGVRDLGEPSPVNPILPYFDTDHNSRKPGEVMNNIGPTDNNPGSAKVIPEGHDFENRKAAGSDLVSRIRKLLPALARAAQEEYDVWNQDEEGYDEECGAGGICDRVAGAFSGVLANLPDVEIVEGGQDGDDHAYVIALTDTEAVSVDIPPRVYETGAGYSWKKKPGVRFNPSHIVLDQLDRGDFDDGARFASAVRVAAKMAEILQGMDPGIRSRARGVTPKIKRSDPGNVVYSFTVPGSKGESYTVKVKGVPSGNVRTISKMDLRLSCTCNFWQWQGPEHWAKAGDYLFGKPLGTVSRPTEKDPDGRNRVCKHALAVLSMISKWPAAGKR